MSSEDSNCCSECGYVDCCCEDEDDYYCEECDRHVDDCCCDEEEDDRCEDCGKDYADCRCEDDEDDDDDYDEEDFDDDEEDDDDDDDDDDDEEDCEDEEFNDDANGELTPQKLLDLLMADCYGGLINSDACKAFNDDGALLLHFWDGRRFLIGIKKLDDGVKFDYNTGKPITEKK